MPLPERAFRKGLRNPKKALRYIWRNAVVKTNQEHIYKRPYLACRSINQRYYERFQDSGNLDVMEEDWDTLILLDACRYDYFEEVSDLPGTLESRRTPGSTSQEFIQSSFLGRELHDTVYVTANPFATMIESGTFHDVNGLVDDYYEDDIRTVLPETVTEAAKEAHEQYPNKRIIVHYMQPHEPFLSDFGQTVSDKLQWQGNQYHVPRTLTLNDLRRAYRGNVELIIEEVHQLLPTIDNRVVVSADHGELLGERLSPIPIRGLEHPMSIHEDAVLKVPWLVIEGEHRRDVTNDGRV